MNGPDDRSFVEVGSAPVTVADVLAVAEGAEVALGPPAIERILASRAVVDALVEGDAPIYGLNTGLGHLRNERMSLEVLRDYQEGIVRTHAGGMGPPLPTPVVRAAMFVRVAGIARGGSGASLGVAEMLVAMLNAGVHPVVPAVGSVGASDLMHMASIALVTIGQGHAELNGEVMPAADALATAGLSPAILEPKDGLTLVSANGVSVGHGVLVVDRARRVADALDVVAAMSFEAARGNPSVVEPVVAAGKPIPGQIAAAEHIRDLIAGSALCEPGGPVSVQDPLSFRVVPQVHGALRELLGFARRAVDDELASMDDNPLVVAEDGRMISNGNFHPMLMALAFDALRPGLAHAGQLSERRIGHHFDTMVADPELYADGGVRIAGAIGGGALLRYAAAARYTELRLLAQPATLDVPALDLNVEDHSTNAPVTVRKTEEALDALEDLMAAELLTARAALRLVGDARPLLGAGTAPVAAAVDAKVAEAGPDASSADIHAAVRALLPDGILATERAPR